MHRIECKPSNRVIKMDNQQIRTIDLCKTYQMGQNGINALANINISIPQGCFLSIMGKSGSGKSTLLHLLGGLDKPTSGSVFIGDQDISSLPESQLSRFRRRHLGFVFQFFNLIPELNLKENIIFPALLENRTYDKNYFMELCETLELEDRLKHLPGQVSGGQQQRTAIARALILKPCAILLDEPTGNLDSASSKAVMRLLKSLSERWQKTVVLVTHDEDAASYADRRLEIRDGRIL